MFTLAKPTPMGRRVPFRLRLSILDVVIPARVGKQSVIDFFIAMYSWPLSIHIPVPIADAESPVRCRYVYGYGVDGSDRPSYLLWPRRGSDGHFWLMDPRSGEFFDPAKATFIAQLGLKHFFDAFALEHKRDVRVGAARALELDDEDILPTLVVKQEVAQQFKLTPVPLPVDPPAKRAKKMKDEESLNDTAVATGDVIMDRASSPESGSESSDSNSDFSSEDGSSDVSDLDKFEKAFKEFGKLTAFFLLYAAWVRSRAERPSVSYTKVTAISQGQAKSCKFTTKTFRQISGSNKFLIAGDGKMKRMREP